jgi:hypothetical protein
MSEEQRPKRLDDLPSVIPVFPLPGAILLPRGRLPLNIFEPRYLNMVDDALAGDRIIGMVQPSSEPEDGSPPEMYSIGCAGRLTAFNETEDGRYLIGLDGVCRFAIKEEVDVKTPYRQVRVDWSRFARDLEPDDEPGIDRQELVDTLQRYLEHNNLDADWPSVQQAGGEALITALSMICPFDPHEKQALLEAPRAKDRAEALIALMRFSLAEGGWGDEDDGPERLQ